MEGGRANGTQRSDSATRSDDGGKATHQQMRAASGSQENREEISYGARGRDTIAPTQWLWDLHNRKVTHACGFKPWATAAGVSHYRSAGVALAGSYHPPHLCIPIPPSSCLRWSPFLCVHVYVYMCVLSSPNCTISPQYQKTCLGSTTIPEVLEV